MGFLQFLYAVVMLVLWSVLLIAVIGTVTVAAAVGGGPLFGLAILALCIANAYVWGGWGKK